MKIILVGGRGNIGKEVSDRLASQGDVIITAGRHTDIPLDISQLQSIQAFYDKVGSFDALIVCAGSVPFKPLAELKAEDFYTGIENKLMGQVNLVLKGLDHMNDGGSFTLTSGILNRDPIISGSVAALVNGAIEGFVCSVAIELPRDIRINCVSPTVLEKSWDSYKNYFQGFVPVADAKVASAYEKSVRGAQTGQIYTVFD